MGIKYMGSKRRIARHILPIILAERTPGQTYIEPFVGGANSFELVTGRRLGADANPYLIAFLTRLRDGTWVPPDPLTDAEYRHVRDNPSLYDPAHVGFVGTGLSYGGRWFEGVCRDGSGLRDYHREAINAALRTAPKLAGADFACSDYLSLEIPPNSLIYLDPPYRGSKPYRWRVDSDRYWEWAEGLVGDGHKVYASEYEAPPGWEMVWEGQIASSLTKNTGAKVGVERLWTLR